MSGNGNVQEADTRSRFPSVMPGLERELNRAPTPAPAPDATMPRTSGSFVTRSPLQTIADALKRLVWDDNEKLAQMIGSHFNHDGDQTASMAAAIQRAADDLINEDSGSRQ